MTYEPTWRGLPFVPYDNLRPVAARQARERFSPEGRQGVWRDISNWSFCVKKDGTLAACRYIEPIGGYYSKP